jgi:hypothetical protein
MINKRGVKYSDEEIKFKNETGLDGPEMNKNRKKAKRFVDFIQGKAARESTATQGSFKNGGLVRSGKPKLSKKRLEIMLKKIKKKICEIICKVFKITPCVCDHECNCKKENK